MLPGENPGHIAGRVKSAVIINSGFKQAVTATAMKSLAGRLFKKGKFFGRHRKIVAAVFAAQLAHPGRHHQGFRPDTPDQLLFHRLLFQHPHIHQNFQDQVIKIPGYVPIQLRSQEAEIFFIPVLIPGKAAGRTTEKLVETRPFSGSQKNRRPGNRAEIRQPVFPVQQISAAKTVNVPAQHRLHDAAPVFQVQQQAEKELDQRFFLQVTKALKLVAKRLTQPVDHLSQQFFIQANY